MSQESDRDLSQLYRAGATEEPPPWLDRRIETAARKDLRPSLLHGFFDSLPRWRLAAGAVAVVTLSVSLVTVMKDEAPSVLAPTASMPSPDARPSEQYAPPASDGSQSAPAEQVQSQKAAPLETAPRDGAPKREERVDRRKAQEREAEAAPSPKQDTADVPKLAEAHPSAAPSAEPPAVAPAPATASPPAPRSGEEARQRASVGDAATLGRLARKEALPAPAASPSIAEESPEAWAKRLSELLRQGREQEVREGLERFRRRYPEFALPEDLRRFLAEAKAPARAVGPAATPDPGPFKPVP